MADERGFSRAALSQEAENTAGGHGEVNVIERHFGAISTGQALDFDYGLVLLVIGSLSHEFRLNTLSVELEHFKRLWRLL